MTSATAPTPSTEHTPPPTPGAPPAAAPIAPIAPDVPHAVFAYDLEDTTYEFDHPTITGAEIMAAGQIPPTEGLIQINADGTRETITAETVVHLATGAHFKRRPRFKRG